MAPDPPPSRKRKSGEVVIEDSDDDDDIQVISAPSASNSKANPKAFSQPVQKPSTSKKGQPVQKRSTQPSTSKKGVRSQPASRMRPSTTNNSNPIPSGTLSQQPSTSTGVTHSSQYSLSNGIGSAGYKAALSAFLTQRPSTSTAPPPQAHPQPDLSKDFYLQSAQNAINNLQQHRSNPNLLGGRLELTKALVGLTVAFDKQLEEEKEERASFCDEFYPTRINEIAGNKAKVNELRKWFEQIKNRTAVHAFGILTGPAGTAKSAAVWIICKQLGLTLRPWQFEEKEDDEYETPMPFMEREMKDFVTFVHRSANDVGKSTDIVKFVDTLPSLAYRDPNKFRKDLADALDKSRRQPLIFCLSDVNSCFEVSPKRIFSQLFLTEYPNFETMSFNLIAKTFLEKALKRVAGKMCSKKPTDQVIEKFAVSCEGDLRSAINSMRFSLEEDGTLKGPDSSLQATLNDELFHMIGRLMFANRQDKPAVGPDWLPLELHRSPPENNINEILEMSKAEPDVMLLYIHDNEPTFSPLMMHTRKCLDMLSVADSLTQRWDVRDSGKEYVAQIGARAAYFYNDGRGQRRGFKGFKQPKWRTLEKQVGFLKKELADNLGFAQSGSTPAIRQIHELAQRRGGQVPVNRDQLRVLTYVTRSMDIPYTIGRQDWNPAINRTTPFKESTTSVLGLASVISRASEEIDTTSDDESDAGDEFVIEDSSDDAPSDDSFDDPVEFVPYNQDPPKRPD